MSKNKTIRSENGDIIPSGMEKNKNQNDFIPSGVQKFTEHQVNEIINSGINISTNQIMLKNKQYAILKRLAASGESETFLVEHDKNNFVLKLYYPNFQPKHEIIERLLKIKHPDIINVIDYGWYKDRFYELMEYAAGGSLDEILPIKDPKKLKQIIQEVVNALHFCHEMGIIHKDIKPSNIFFRDLDRKDIVIGDFGISTAFEEGFSKKLTSSQARTLIYAAPEMFQSIKGKTIIDKSVDYYALGITIIHLWIGHEPFEGLGDYGIMRVKMEGAVNIPQDMPREFQTLVKGLITVNPKYRWGYEEVQRWLRGEEVSVHFELHKEYPPFIFSMEGGKQIIATDPQNLADLMEKYPELGKRHLYRKAISEWLKPVNQFLYSTIESIVEEEYPKDQEAGLIKSIYVLDPDRPFRGVNMEICSTPDEIASHIEKYFNYYEKDLTQPNAPLYLYLEARGYKNEADKFRKLFKEAGSTKAVLNTLILALEGGNTFVIDTYRFQEPEKLLDANDTIKQRLAKDLADPQSKLSLWLQQFPEFRDTIEKWRLLKRYDTITLRYALKGGFILKEIPEFSNLQVVINSVEDLKKFLNNHPNAILSAEQIYELNYFLKYYLDTSLNKVFLEIAKNVNQNDFINLVKYALNNFEDLELDPFSVLQWLLGFLKSDKKEVSLNEIAKITADMLSGFAKHIEKVGDENLAVSYIKGFLKILEAYSETYIEFWQTVVNQMPDRVFTPLAHVVANGDAREFGELYEKFLTKITSLLNSGNLIQRFNWEKQEIEKQTAEIETSIDRQRKQKIEIVKNEYNKLIAERTEKAKKENKGLRWRVIVSLIIVILAFFNTMIILSIYDSLLDLSAFDLNDKLGRALESGGFITVGIFVIIGIIFAFGSGFAEEEGAWAALLGGALGGAIVGLFAFFFSSLILPIAFAFFLYYLIKYRKAIMSASALTPGETKAMAESIKRIEEYYYEIKKEKKGKIVVSVILK